LITYSSGENSSKLDIFHNLKSMGSKKNDHFEFTGNHKEPINTMYNTSPEKENDIPKKIKEKLFQKRHKRIAHGSHTDIEKDNSKDLHNNSNQRTLFDIHKKFERYKSNLKTHISPRISETRKE
jgi:hypothetical protein